MRNGDGSYDVAIAGASIAGCTAARLFAQRGARVALIEKRPALDAHKTVCTHFIQSSATPVIEKLGLAALIEERGAVRNAIDIWSRYGGWVQVDWDAPYGYSVTRMTMDPLLRRLTAETPGVELMAGWTVTALAGDERPEGVEIESPSHERRRIAARLVVAADGRDSGIARMASVPGRVRPHNRFFYWAYWRGVKPETKRAAMWLIEPDCAYVFPNEDGLALVLVAPHRQRLPEFRADLEGAYMRMVRSLPDGPQLRDATRESKILGKLELPNVSRPAARPGLAFAGDAALAGDPLWGVGCGWAFQSADWLVEQTAEALAGGLQADIDAGLERYRKLHAKRLGPHHFLLSDLAGGRPLNAFERRMWRRAAEDPVLRRAVERIGSRSEPPSALFRPRTLARLVAPTVRR
jgi:2-polyprenyl-6-methoxyphenol hydroxylase-like FAD-dependent oxidoreductase